MTARDESSPKMLVDVWRTWGRWRMSKQLSTHPHAPMREFMRLEERIRVDCLNEVWLALTKRGTFDTLVGVVAGRNGWLLEKSPAMRESNGSELLGKIDVIGIDLDHLMGCQN